MVENLTSILEYIHNLNLLCDWGITVKTCHTGMGSLQPALFGKSPASRATKNLPIWLPRC